MTIHDDDSNSTGVKRAAADTTPPVAKKRKLRKGTKKSKAERLARRSATDAPPVSLDELRALLDDPQSHTSNEWDAAQSLALRIGSTAAKELVVSKVLWAKQAPKAAAHYAKRLQLSEASVRTVLLEPPSPLSHDDDGSKQHAAPTTPSVVDADGVGDCCKGAAHLLVAKFLTDVSAAVMSNRVRLETFLWPWLVEQARAKSAADARARANKGGGKESESGARDDGSAAADTPTAAAPADDDDNTARKAAQSHAMQAHAAAIRLLLQHPTASGVSATTTSKHPRTDECEELQRLLVEKCIAEGELLHFVSTYARAFAPLIARAIAAPLSADDPYIVDAGTVEREQLRRQHVAERIEALLRLMWPDARVLVFGSSATGLLHIDAAGVCSDDLDLCVLLPSSPVVREDTAALVVEMREHLAVYLPPGTELLAIEGARVPIVQFTDPKSALRCDVCVNNAAALWNTQLTRRLLRAGGTAWSTRTHALSCWLKRWRSTKRQLFGRGLSSYGLQLLLFYYLQRRGVLPTLALDDDVSARIETPASLQSFDSEAVDCALAAAEVPSSSVEPSDPMPSFWAALLGFFEFYAMDFDFEHAVVSLRSAAVVTKEQKQWTRKTWKAALSLEDPIEVARDLGTLFNRKSLAKFRTAIVHACVLLAQPREDTEAALMRCMPYDIKELAGSESNE